MSACTMQMDVDSLHSENGTSNRNGGCAERVENGTRTNQEEEEESLPENEDAELADKMTKDYYNH